MTLMRRDATLEGRQACQRGFEPALASLPSLKRGVATHQGQIVNAMLASHLGVPEVTL